MSAGGSIGRHHSNVSGLCRRRKKKFSLRLSGEYLSSRLSVSAFSASCHWLHLVFSRILLCAQPKCRRAFLQISEIETIESIGPNDNVAAVITRDTTNVEEPLETDECRRLSAHFGLVSDFR